MSYRELSKDEHFQAAGPKRILSLDGGGLRGIVSLVYLKRIEELLRARHGGGPDFRLSHYFDLIAGTSTGAIIAAGLAIGLSVDELIDSYESLGKRVFRSRWWRKGIWRERYDEQALIKELKAVFGERSLGDESLETGLLIVAKRMDTGSPWPLGNNPAGAYFKGGSDAAFLPNADYPLWRVVRASTAAPVFFAPEEITIARQPGRMTLQGLFVDGGVSPHNNPALQALMYATLDGFRLRWPTGKDRMLIVSLGTGSADPSQRSSILAASRAINALKSLMEDCGDLVETIMQWLSDSPTAKTIDGEIGDLAGDLLTEKPAFTYQRYQLDLTPKSLQDLMPELSQKEIRGLTAMDRPENLPILKRLAELTADVIRSDHFPKAFDHLRESDHAEDSELRPYRRRANTAVTAIPLDLSANSDSKVGDALFTYHKWDNTQTAKTGDWLVNNGNEVYTVDRETFENSYAPTDADGQYIKTRKVWARRATEPGAIQTKEGSTPYEAGDWLVFNQPNGEDGYAIRPGRFSELYERVK